MKFDVKKLVAESFSTMPMDEESKRALQDVLTKLRALYLVELNSHWESAGPSAYADHLMYERLYKSAQEDMDSIAERGIGLTNKAFVRLDDAASYLTALLKDAGGTDLAARCMHYEQLVIYSIRECLDEMRKRKTITDGLDDLLMSVASNRETSQYLLKQRKAT